MILFFIEVRSLLGKSVVPSLTRKCLCSLAKELKSLESNILDYGSSKYIEISRAISVLNYYVLLLRL